jgi:ribosomal-protein-alanine N-acetyltransferase
MQSEEIPEVMAIDRLSFRSPWSEISYRSEISNSAAYYLVARIGGRVVGYAGAWLVVDEAHITTLGVHPDFRRRGIGERLLVAILTEARGRGVRRASLEVRESNRAATGLYEKYGFHPIARRKAYYRDTGEDAVVMGVLDLASPAYDRLLAERTAARV